MREELKSNYTKIITIKDMYNIIINNILIIILIGVIVFSIVAFNGILERGKSQTEKPVYRSVLNISIDYDFLDTSILRLAKTTFTEDSFQKIKDIENIEMSGKDILDRVYYNAESKRNMYVTVYSLDKDTGIMTLDGVINVIIPKLSLEVDKSDINQNFVEVNRKVKINDLNTKTTNGLVSIDDLKVITWEEYKAKYGIKAILKKSFTLSFYSMFIYIIGLLLYRFFSKKIFSISDIRSCTGIDVIAVSDNKYNGIKYIVDRIKAREIRLNHKIGILPVSNSEKLNNTIKKICNIDNENFIVIDALESSYDILKKVMLCNEIVVFCEYGKTTLTELQNTLDLINDISKYRVSIVLIGVNNNDLKKNKEYFCRFYPD